MEITTIVIVCLSVALFCLLCAVFFLLKTQISSQATIVMLKREHEFLRDKFNSEVLKNDQLKNKLELTEALKQDIDNQFDKVCREHAIFRC